MIHISVASDFDVGTRTEYGFHLSDCERVESIVISREEKLFSRISAAGVGFLVSPRVHLASPNYCPVFVKKFHLDGLEVDSPRIYTT